MQYRSRNNARPSIRVLKPAVLAVALGCTAQVAAVEGGAIVAGNGGIATQGRNTVVSQASDRMVVNWKNFDIARNQSVEFRQPGARSAVLNRVTSASPTEILGALKANGQVFVVNPQGVMFGRTAKVDVGSLVASALDTSADQFMAGGVQFPGNARPGSDIGLPRYVVLEGTGAGSVRNEGAITAREGVVLAGPKVANQGTIRARNVALQAGSGVAVSMGGFGFMVTPTIGQLDALAENSGTIIANGGNIALSAAAKGTLLGDVVRNTGRLEATRANAVGGRIELTAPMDGAISIGGKVRGDRVMANTTPFVYATDVPHPGLDYTGELAKHGHDIRVENGARVTSASHTEFGAVNDIAVNGRIEGGSVDLWAGGNVSTQAPIRVTGNVKVQAYGNLDQNADIVAKGDNSHVWLTGGAVRQADGVTTRGDRVIVRAEDRDHVDAVRLSDVDAKYISITGKKINLDGDLKADGDIAIEARDRGCPLDMACIEWYDPATVVQNGDIISRGGNVRILGVEQTQTDNGTISSVGTGELRQSAGTRTKAGGDVSINMRKVDAGYITAGNKIDIHAGKVRLTGPLTAKVIVVPENTENREGNLRIRK